MNIAPSAAQSFPFRATISANPITIPRLSAIAPSDPSSSLEIGRSPIIRHPPTIAAMITASTDRRPCSDQ
jgi:hypothetical protein